MNDKSLSFVFASVLVVFAGCGGGGGGGSSSPTVLPAATITETNKKQVAGTAVRGDFRSLGAFGGGAVAVVPANSALLSKDTMTTIVAGVVNRVRTFSPTEMESPAARVREGSVQCVPGDASKGTISVRFDDKNDDEEFTNGDSIEATFDNCFDDQDDSSTNGKVTFKFINVLGFPLLQITPWSFVADAIFSGFRFNFPGRPPFTLDGPLRWSQTQNTQDEALIAASGSNLKVVSSSDNLTISNYAVTFTENDATNAYSEYGTETVSSTALGASFVMTVEPSKPLKGIDPNFPDSGVITITGENSALTLTAIDNINVQLDLDSNKDGVVDSSEIVTWESLI
jgi:hypothetical protein